MIRARALGAALAPLGFVTPEMFGAAGDGVTDDTAAFTSAKADGRPIMLNKSKTYCVDGLVFNSTDTCPGMFSLGGRATITTTSTSTTSSRLIEIRKDDFRVDNIAFSLPISTNATVAPIGQIALYWLPVSSISRAWVTNCYFKGGAFQCNFSGQFKEVYVANNLFESSWADASDANECHQAVYIGNQFINCGYSSTGSLAAPLRISSSTQATPAELISVIGNTWKDCCVGLPQESLDISGAGIKNILVANNNVSGVGNGFVETKTSATNPTDSSSYYCRHVYVGNNVELVAGQTCIGFDLHLSLSGTPSGKAGQVLITGNQVRCASMPGSSDGTQAVVIQGWDDVTITANSFINIGAGIRLDTTNISGTSLHKQSIIGNKIYCYTGTIATAAAGTYDQISVIGNHLRAVARVCSFANGTITNLFVISNYIKSDTEYGIELRDTQSATIFGNVFDTVNSCMLVQGTASGAVVVKNNLLRASNDNALTFTTGTALVASDNMVEVPTTKRTVTGAATYTAANNSRDLVSADPSATYAMAVGDVFKNSAPSAGGALLWACVTAGNAGAGTAKALNLAA